MWSRCGIHGLTALVVVATGLASSSTRTRAQCSPATVVGLQGNGHSQNVSVSADGRYLAFDSAASDLIAGDTNGVSDVFVYDRIACALDRVSVSSAGAAGNGGSNFPSISDDGNIVSFASLSTNLIDGVPDNDGLYDVYLRNRSAGTTVRVSESTAGVQGNSHSTFSAVSGDGAVVAFHSAASNLVANDTNGEGDIFVRAAGATSRVSVDSSGIQGDDPFNVGVDLWRPSLSATGRYVVFASNQINLVADDTNGVSDVFRHDRQTGSTVRMSASSVNTAGNFGSFSPSISADGRHVAFQSLADNLVGGGSDNNGFSDVFVRDTLTNITTRVSLANQGQEVNGPGTFPAISGDGRYVAFMGGSDQYVIGDTNGQVDIFVHDRQTTITRRVSTSAGGIQSDHQSQYPDISNNGLFVAFESLATTLVGTNPAGTNWYDAFNVNWPLVSTPPNIDLMRNGDFGIAGYPFYWSLFATPNMTAMPWHNTNGVFHYYKTGFPCCPNQAVIFQQTTAQLLPGAPILLQAQIGNTDIVAKRISVLAHDADFTDLHVCTFWIPPGAALQTYTMRTHTTKNWANLTVSFYAASGNAQDNTTGYFQLDNVTVRYDPAGVTDRTLCEDPSTPAAPSGSATGDVITNGGFESGLPPWTTFGQINSQISGGVFEFIKLTGNPAGVVLQVTGQPMAASQILTSTFLLGNSSSVRKRVTVIVHDNDFSDLAACTFWLTPGQPLTPYRIRSFTTKAWANTTISIYPATLGAHQWIRLDDVTVAGTPATSIVGTECVENSSSDRMSVPAPRRTVYLPPVAPTVDDVWEADGFEPSLGGGWSAAVAATPSVLEQRAPMVLDAGSSARLSFRSWLTGGNGRGLVQVAADGGDWSTVFVARASDTWVPIEIDLSAVADRIVRVRFVVDGAGASLGEPDTWRIEDITID